MSVRCLPVLTRAAPRPGKAAPREQALGGAEDVRVSARLGWGGRRARRPFGAALGLLLASCASPPTAKAPAPDPPSLWRPAGDAEVSRWYPRLPHRAALFLGEERHQGRWLAVGTQRWLQAHDGVLTQAEERLGEGQLVAACALSAEAGGGVALAVVVPSGPSGSPHTRLWRAPSWLAKAEPLVELAGEVTSLSAVGATLMLSFERSGEVIAWDLESRKLREPTELPLAPSYRGLTFAAPQLGVVEVPLRGVLVTTDGARHWSDTGLFNLSQSEVTPWGLEFVAQGARRRLQRSGAMTRLQERPAALGEPNQAPLRDWRREAVLYGWPAGDGVAQLIEGGRWREIELATGRSLRSTSVAHATGTSPCRVLPVGGRLGALCRVPSVATRLVRLDGAGHAEPWLSLSGDRRAVVPGNGALLLSDGCGEAISGRWCVVPAQGAPWTSSSPHGPSVARVTVTRDGALRGVTLPPPGGTGALWEEHPERPTRSVRLTLSTEGSHCPELTRATWLEDWWPRQDGGMQGWLVRDQGLQGISVDGAGKVSCASTAVPIEETLTSGPLALLRSDAAGALQQSSDGGFTWQRAEAPETQLDPVRDWQPQGCSPLGCALGDWLRVGWGPSLAPSAALPSQGSLRRATLFTPWALECSVPDAPQSSRKEAELFASLEEESRPQPGAAHPLDMTQRVEAGQGRLHVAVWGDESRWAQSSRWQLAIEGHQGARATYWRTAVARSPWARARSGSEALFRLDAMDGPPPSWELALDPAGDEGVVRLRQDGADRLFLVQPGVIPHELSPRDSGLLGYVAGYARTADHHRFLLTSDAERSLTLWRLEEDALVFVWRQSTPSGSLSAALVRDRAGRRLALWLREAPGAHYGSPWYFYPLDERGRAQAPELVGATVFDAALRPCTEDAEGWWLVGPPPGIPTAALSDDEAASVTLDEVEMLLKPDAGCLLGAHAPAAGIPVNTTRASLKPGIPLRVSEMVSERLWTCHAP